MSLAAAAAVLLITAGVIVIARRPGEYRVSRSQRMAAPPAAIFPHVNELQAWRSWSPFEKTDPNIVMTFSAPSSGVGAVTHFKGNAKADSGSNTIVESIPNELIRFRLAMVKPIKADNDVEFTFELDGNETGVTGAMSGRIGFVFKAVHLVMNMDKICGSMFARCHNDLKAIVEREAAVGRAA